MSAYGRDTPAERVISAAARQFARNPRGTRWAGGGLQSHEWKRVERLESVWEQARMGLGSLGSAAGSGLAGAVTEPKRRSRTPLTPKQMDAIDTARDNGESVMSIARRFEVSRMTVGEKTQAR